MRSLKIGLIDLLGLACLSAIYLKLQSLAGDPGFGWHLKSGELLAADGPIFRFDPFLNSESPQLWIHNQWLADLWFFKLYEVGGFALLTAFAALLLMSSYFLIIGGLLKKLHFSPLVIFFVLALAIFQGAIQWFLRPVLFSFLLFSLVYCRLVLISKSSTVKSDFIFFPLIFYLWANLHPAFVLGLFTIAVFIAGSLIDMGFGRDIKPKAVKGVLYLLVLSIIACLLNPYGEQLFGAIFSLSSSSYFMNLNSEWLSSQFWIKPFLPFLVASLISFTLFIKGAGKKMSSFNLLLFSVFLVLALYQRRLIPYFGIVLSYPLAEMLTVYLENLRESKASILKALFRIEMRQVNKTSQLYTLVFLFFIVGSVSYLGHFPGKEKAELGFKAILSEEDLTVLKSAGSKKIFHSPDMGGYLTWMLWPDVRASIDDRNILNGEQSYKNYSKIIGVRAGWEEAVSSYSHLIISENSPLALVILQQIKLNNSAWELLSRNIEEGDEQLLVFKRR